MEKNSTALSPRQELDIMSASTTATNNLPPSILPLPIEKYALNVNALQNALGMSSFGILAMLETHRNLIGKIHISLVIIFDLLAFFTSFLGKYTVMEYFTKSVVQQLSADIYNRGIVNYIKSFVTETSFWQKIGILVNIIITLNASLFWAGLVGLSFLQCGEVLLTFNSSQTKIASKIISNIGCYFFFQQASFYCNILAWPTIHYHAYQKFKALINKFQLSKQQRNRINQYQYRMQHGYNKLMQELKTILHTKETDYQSLEHPLLNAIFTSIAEHNNEDNYIALTSIEKISYLGKHLDEHNIELRKLMRATLQKYLIHIGIDTRQYYIRHGCALLFCAITIWGFSNLLGLNDDIWAYWGCREISTYGGRYLAFFSMVQMILQAIYDMFYDLSGKLFTEKFTCLFSKCKHSNLIIATTLFALGSGVSNAEESFIDNESSLYIIMALWAAFNLDFFGIYYKFRTTVENSIINNSDSDPLLISSLHVQKFSLFACHENIGLDETIPPSSSNTEINVATSNYQTFKTGSAPLL